MSKKLEDSKANGVHQQLARLVGNWEGTSKVWFEPGEPVDESPVTGTMRAVLDGRFILHEYQSKFGDKPLEGLALYGYHLELEQYQSAWVDSFHNNSAIMFSKGERKDPAFSMLGSYVYVTPEQELQGGWRTQIDVLSDDEIVITAYNIMPGEAETKATEIVYKRKK